MHKTKSAVKLQLRSVCRGGEAASLLAAILQLNIALMETDLKHLDHKTERKQPHRPVYSPEHVRTLHDPRTHTERRQVTCLLLAVNLLLLLLTMSLYSPAIAPSVDPETTSSAFMLLYRKWLQFSQRPAGGARDTSL